LSHPVEVLLSIVDACVSVCCFSGSEHQYRSICDGQAAETTLWTILVRRLTNMDWMK